MKAARAVVVMVVLCVVIASLLLGGIIAPLTGGVIFAVGIVTIGLLARGFTSR